MIQLKSINQEVLYNRFNIYCQILQNPRNENAAPITFFWYRGKISGGTIRLNLRKVQKLNTYSF